jgi:hypothetical protein
MKKTIACITRSYSCALTLLLLLSAHNSHSQTLAFPGAEGFGRYTSGARGVSAPTVYRVTNLNDAGSGSLVHRAEL